MSSPTELRARAAELEQRVPPIHAGPRTDDERMWLEKATALRAEADRLLADTGTTLWNVQKFDQTIGVYTNLEAAKDHGKHVIHAHYQDAMDRRRVPESHRAVDWRVHCCGHLYGPGSFDHTAYPVVHADGCPRPDSRVLVLRPFWAATGTSARTGHVSTDWEIWQGTAYDRFDPSTVYA